MDTPTYTTPHPATGRSVRAVRSADELDAVGRLRYDIYVRRLGRSEAHADHQRGRIVEPLDHSGVVFAAFQGERAIGTVRQNLLADSEAASHRGLYGVTDLAGAGDVLSTKLIVDDQVRGSRLALELACASFEWALEQRARRAWLDCNAHLRRFFERLGYRVARAGVQHPQYGEVAVMFIEPFDRDHLVAVGSPFLALLSPHRP